MLSSFIVAVESYLVRYQSTANSIARKMRMPDNNECIPKLVHTPYTIHKCTDRIPTQHDNTAVDKKHFSLFFFLLRLVFCFGIV